MYIHGHREKDLEKKKFSPIFIRLFSFFLNNFLSLSEFRVEKLKKVIVQYSEHSKCGDLKAVSSNIEEEREQFSSGTM